MNKPLIFAISHLIEASTGSSQKFSFEGPVTFEDFKAISDISGRADVMRIEGGLNVIVNNLSLDIELTCEKCLNTFIQNVSIPKIERQYYFHLPGDIEDQHDIFLVDNKNLTVDLSEPVRQEIILHLPLIRVCSKGCKGLCPQCGKNRNLKECNCKDTTPEPNKSLSILKDLYVQTSGTKKENS